MRARADAVADTRRRIMQAAYDLTGERMSLEIVLADVAERAGVSIQTILRHFGTREALFDAVGDFARETIAAERATPAGDVPAAVHVIFGHYELRGDVVLRFLAQEFWDERAREVTERGRRMHREWVRTVFAPQLDGRSATDQEALTDLLVVATDVYTWKLLRRDRQLEREPAERRVLGMIRALLAAPPEGDLHGEHCLRHLGWRRQPAAGAWHRRRAGRPRRAGAVPRSRAATRGGRGRRAALRAVPARPAVVVGRAVAWSAW